MSTEEAYVKVHGDIETLRDGDQTHQNIQTNLADIISGGEFKHRLIFKTSNYYILFILFPELLFLATWTSIIYYYKQ